VKTSGEGPATIISLDGSDVDNDIYIFLEHSFGELQSRHSDFPQPARDDDRLQLMLELTSELLAGTEVYKLYDRILSTCADPKRAYLHLSIVAVLADPLPLSQISKLLGPGQGCDVEATLGQLRSVMNIPTDTSLPVNVYHSSIRDYVSDPSNCSLTEVHDMPSPHSLLADSSLRLMMKEIPESTDLLDALLELRKESHAMQPEDPKKLKDSLAFLVQPLSVLIGMLWLRGDRTTDLQSWLGAEDGSAWLGTKDGCVWLGTEGGFAWLQTHAGYDWLCIKGERWWKTQEGQDWLQTGAGIDFNEVMVEAQSMICDLQVEAQGAQDWPEFQGAQDWLQTQEGRDWLQTWGGQGWLQTWGGQDWLQTWEGRGWLQTQGGREWLQTEEAQDWLQTQRAQCWLLTPGGQDWLQTRRGRDWLQTQGGRD